MLIIDQWPTDVLLISVLFRQGLIIFLRKVNRHQYIHIHDSMAFFPLGFTICCCLLALSNNFPSLGANIFSPAHLLMVFAPQFLTWFWCLKSRGEISKSDFTENVILLTTVVLFLAIDGSEFAPLAALFLSLGGLFLSSSKSKNFRQRPCFIWSCLIILCIQKSNGIKNEEEVENKNCCWIISLEEVLMMFLMKFKIPLIFSFDRKEITSSGEEKYHRSSVDLESDLLKPPDLNRSDSINSQSSNYSPTPNLVIPHHRRDVSLQSNGSWGWGPIVQDFGKSLSPRMSISSSSSDENLFA